MYTVYAFCKEVDNAVDEPPPGTDPRQQLELWRQELAAAYRGSPTFPVTRSLAEHVRRLSIPQTYFEELIKGVEMDLTVTRYASFESLSLYCYRVASVVGLICLHIFGTTSPRAQDYAVNLGMAFQLTNILRDLRTDAEKGRIYVPQEDFARFGYTEHDLVKQTYNLSFADLMRFEAQRAREYYAKAERALHALPPNERRALTVAEIMRAVYSRILERMQASEFRVFEQRVTLSTRHRLLLAAGVWLRSRWLPMSSS
jgi:phytoene synthase